MLSRIDGGFLADPGDFPAEVTHARPGAHSLFEDRQTPLDRFQAAAKLGQRHALPAAGGNAPVSCLISALDGRHQYDHLLADPVRINAQAVQNLGSGVLALAVILADQAEQEVPGAEGAVRVSGMRSTVEAGGFDPAQRA